MPLCIGGSIELQPFPCIYNLMAIRCYAGCHFRCIGLSSAIESYPRVMFAMARK
jgi:hypothetical protein